MQLPTPNSGLRVFSACLLSYLLIVMPFAQVATASVRGTSPTVRESSSSPSEAKAAENVFVDPSLPGPVPVPLVGPVIVATKDDGLAAATTVAPSGTITYTVNINNNGTTSPADDATGVSFSDTIDAHTTLVPGSPVAAVSDKYNTVGNTQIIVPDGSTDLLGNDFDPPGDNTGMTVTAYGATTGTEQTVMGTATLTAQNGSVTVQSNGSFTYDPPLGFEGTDTFKYRAADSGGFTAITTVKITIAGMIWFINNNAGACTSSCDGRLSHPFQTLAAFQAVNNGTGSNPAAGDSIFLYESATAYVGPVTLLNTQRFIGQDATATLASITGFSAPSGTDPFPAMNTGGNAVTITGSNANGINLGIDNRLRGFTVGNTGTGTKINGISFGTLIVGNSASPDVTLNGTGQALNLSTGVLSVTGGFVSVATTSSAGQGISLAAISDSDGAGGSSFSFGSTTVSGSTTQGILIGTTTADLNLGNTSITGGTDGISFQNNSSGTRTIGTLGVSGGSGRAFLHGAGGGNVTVTGAATLSSANSAVDVASPGATNVINFQAATSATSTGAGNTAVSWAGVSAASITFNSLSIQRNNATALSATGGGTVNVTNATGSINNTTDGGSAIVASAVALNANFSAINSSGGTNGVSLTNVSGTSSWNGGLLTGTALGATFNVSGGTASVTYSGGITQASNAAMVFIGGGHTTGTITFQTGTLSATGGTGLQFDNADSTTSYNFNGTTTLNGGDAGIDILNGSAGTFNFGGTTITNPTGVALFVSTSTGAISISGTISKNNDGKLIDFDNYDTGTATISGTLSCTSTCDGVEVTNNGASSGTVNFSGGTKTLNTSASVAVNLDNNDGGTVNFTGGGLDIDTTTATGFNAINGGTVNVSGTTNTINTTSGVAANLVGVGGALTFQRIDVSNGGANGMFLQNTTGTFTVTGNSAGNCGGVVVDKNTAPTAPDTADCTGGTIQNAATGIRLDNVQNVSLTRMRITGTSSDNFGIFGTSVNGFSLAHSVIHGSIGATSGAGDAPLVFGVSNPSGSNGLAGTSAVTDSTISGGIEHNFEVYQQSGSFTLNITRTVIQSNSVALGSDGFLIETQGTSNGTVTIDNCHFNDNKSQASQANSLDTSTLDITVKNSWLRRSTQGNEGLVYQAASGSHLTVHFLSNRFTGILGTNMLVGNVALNSTSASSLNAVVSGNTMTVGASGGPYPTNRTLIAFPSSTNGQVAVSNYLIDGNTINTFSDPVNGIAEPLFVSTPDGVADPSFTATVTNNIVNIDDPGGTSLRGIAIQSTEDTSQGCFDVRGNDVNYSPSAPAGVNGLRVRQVNPATAQLEQGASAGSAATVLAANNPLSTTEVIGTVTVVSNSTCQSPPPLLFAPGGVDSSLNWLSAGSSAYLGQPAFDYPNDQPANMSSPALVGVSDSLTAPQLDSIVAAAIDHWTATGLTQNQIDTLRTITFDVSDLSGAYLGEAGGNVIVVDRDAGGKGWFVDATPADNAEFDDRTSATRSYTNPFTSAAGRVDLLTAIEHEIGHKLGLSDSYSANDRDSIMYGYLTVGERRVPANGQAVNARAGSLIGTHHLKLDKAEARGQRSEVRKQKAVSRKNHAATTRALAPVSGETVTANIGTLPAGGSVTITFQVTVNNPPNLTLLSPPRVENQGTVSGSNFASVLTDDPETILVPADKTATRIDLFDTTNALTCTPDPSGNGQQVTCTATLTENPAQAVDPTGTMDFIDTSNANAVICNDVAISGPAGGPYTAQCQTSSLTVGTHNLRADYSGDGNFDVSQSNLYAQDVLACVTNPIVTTNADAGAGSLRQAIADACDGNTIDFNITGAGPHTIQLVTGSGALAISKNLTINNTSGESITVNGAAGIRVFTVASGKTVAISNLTIAGGAPTGVNFEDKIGGGILNQGTLTLTNCTVSGNTAAEFGGGGIYNYQAGATLNLITSTVSGNHATGTSSGGGIYNNGGTVTLTDSTVSGNDAAGNSGGIHNDSGTAGLTDSTVSGNTANFGGGITTFGTLTLTNSTISGNNANTDGGGLFDNHSSGSVTLTSVTITNNRADNDNNATGTGGGIFVFGTSLQPLLRNTIVAGNFNENGASDAADDIAGTVDATSSFNLIGTGGAGGLTNAVDNNQVGVASPGLGALINNGGPTFTHALLTGSPAIDQGDDFALTTDQRGQPRPVDNPGVTNLSGGTGDGSDIGAFEKSFSPIPVVTTTAGNLSYTENDPATAIDPGLTVNDDDSTNLTGATVAITANFASGEDTLAFTNQLGITGNYDAGTGVLTLTGSATVADYQAALRTVTYQNSSNNPSTLTRTVTFTVNDGANSGSNTRGIAVTAVNDPPVNTVPGAQATGEDTNLVFTGGNAISIADVDAGAAVVQVTLNATNGTVTLNGTAGLSFVFSDANGTGAGDGTADATMTFRGTISAINTALNGLIFTPTPNFNGAAGVQIITNDLGNTGTGGAQSDTDSISITVNSINDPPAGTNNTVSIAEDTSYTFTAADFGFTDPNDSPANTLLAVKITTLPGLGTLTNNNVAVNAGDFIPVADINGGLLKFTPAAEGNGTPYTTFTFQVQDNGGGSDLDPTPNTMTINVTAANDAPVNTVPGPQGTNQNTALTFSSGNGNQISVADVDAGSNTIQVTLTVTNGTLTLSGTSGLSFSFSDANGTGAGDGTADATMTFRGTIANINAALNGMTYTPTLGFSGAASLTITSNDLGNTGSGGPLSDTDVVNIQVSTNVQVNDATTPEPASGTSSMLFTVTLSAPAPAGGGSVQYQTVELAPALNHATAGTCGTPSADYQTVPLTTLNFAAGEQFKTVAVTICADTNAAESNETFEVQLSNPVNMTIADGTATGTITTTNTAGTLLISELRTSGPGGATDEFVEIYNNSDSPHVVPAGGYGLFMMGATCADTPILVGTIPATTTIPARGHFLFTGSAYSLGNYGGSGAAAGDATLSSDIENDRNVGLFSTANVAAISSANRFDAVGFGANTGSVCDLLREGTTQLAVNGSTAEYSYFRKQCDFVEGVGCSTPGNPKDTNDNSVDFLLADTVGTAFPAGFGNPPSQRLGAPGPENLASPIRRDTGGLISVVLLDHSKASSAVPNRVRNSTSDPGNNSTFGTLEIRRRVINNTGGSVTRLRFRIVEMTTYPQPPGRADLRARTSSAIPVSPVGDASNCAEHGTPTTPPCTVTVNGTTLETPPAQPSGGGLNSTMTVLLGTPLPNGQSVNVNFLLGIQQTGNFRFLIIVEALP